MAEPPSDPDWAHALAEQRGALLRFARARLRDPWLAEDLVHDVIEAVWSGRAIFERRSTLGTWLIGVLKHKIADEFRRSARTPPETSRDADSDPLSSVVCPMARPDEIVELRQRLSTALDTIDALPEGMRQVMRLRAIQERDDEQVCRELGISKGALLVRLHRARLRMGRA
jgi:RNA polymerase sigma-70 factor (ECF subfamily)